MLGLYRKEIRLEPYDAHWRALFERERSRILTVFAGDANLLGVFHVGSTSVAGALAKPLLDLALSVRNLDSLNHAALESLGYLFKQDSDMPGRRYFVRRMPGEISTHHVHCFPSDSVDLRDQLLFRSYLCAHPEAVERYNALKIYLSQTCSRPEYTQGKTTFVRETLSCAREDAALADAVERLARGEGIPDVSGAPCTTVYFVRHAQKEQLRRGDFTHSLTDQGRQDSALVTRYLRQEGADVLLSSPEACAMETVEGFAREMGLVPELVDDFRERIIGEEDPVDLASYARRQWEDFGYKLVQGESLLETQSRAVEALYHVLEEYAGRRIAISSHMTALCTVLRYFDSALGYEAFLSLKGRTPWIVRLEFCGGVCTEIRHVDPAAYEEPPAPPPGDAEEPPSPPKELTLRLLDGELSVCKVRDLSQVSFEATPVFAARTDEEISLVCPIDSVPKDCLCREDGWRAMRVEGALDFSLTGILARLSQVLAQCGVSIFAVSTYNTDYILVRIEQVVDAVAALTEAGYRFENITI